MSGFSAIVLAGIFWASVGLFARFLGAYELSPFYMVILRTSVAVFCLGSYLVLFRRGLLVIDRCDFTRFVGAGFVAIVLTHPALFLSLQANAIAVATILLYTSPFYVIILSRFLYGEPITWRKCIALLLALVGLALVVNVFDLDNLAVTPMGFGIGLLAGFLQGVQTLVMKGVSVRYHAATALFYTFGFGLIILWLILLVVGVSMPIVLPGPAWLGVVGVGLITTLIPFLLFTWGLKRTEAGKASIASMLEPIAASLFGYLVLKEQVALIQIVGMALMLTGIAIVALPEKGSHAAADTPTPTSLD
ncbi:MAG: DMT family transporter [bacterium]